MKQYIQRPGLDPSTNKPYAPIALEETGYTSLQEASDLGNYSPVAAPEAPILPQSSGIETSSGATEQEETSSSDAFSTREDYDARVAKERARLKEAQEAERAAKRAEISAQYDPYITEAKEFQVDIGEATKGRFATDRRLSTAALSFVDFRVNEANKKVKELEKQKEIALAKLDTSLADSLEKQMKEFKESERFWIKRKDDLAKETFDQYITTEKLKLSQAATEISLAREERLASADLRTRTLENISSLAESNISLDQISAEERDQFELRAGLPQGSFEAIYTSYQEAKQAERVGDEVKLHSSIATLLDKVPPSTEILIGSTLYKGRKEPSMNIITKEQADGTVISIGLNKKTGEELYRVNLGNIGKGVKGTKPSPTFKIASGAKNKMIAAGISLDDISALETNLRNGHSLDEIFGAEGTTISPEQQTVIRNALSEITPKIGKFDNLTDDQFTLAYMAGYADEDGEVDAQAFLAKENADVIIEADRRGFLEADDKESRNFIQTQLARIKKGVEVFTKLFK